MAHLGRRSPYLRSFRTARCARIGPHLLRAFPAWYQHSHRRGSAHSPSHGTKLVSDQELQLGQAWGNQSHTIDVLFPRVATELLPESESRFFEKLSAAPITFSRNAGGKATGLTLHYRGKMISYEKISDEPPKASEPPKRPFPSSWAQNFSMPAFVATNLCRTPCFPVE